MYTTRSPQSIALIECDMCYKIEPVPMTGKRLASKRLIQAGWFIKGLSVICPQCKDLLQES